MILYICIAAISIILAYMCGRVRLLDESSQVQYALPRMDDSRGRLFARACLVSIFVILFALSACRINVGNDYAKYVEFMHRLYTDKYIADPGVPTEWGFNILTRIVYALSGGENFLLMFAIFAFITISLFMVAMWQQSEDFALTFFMFMCLGYYYQSFSTVRYYVALAIALYCMKLVAQRRWICFLLCVLLGTGIHKSILVILPIYLLASYAWKKWQVCIVLAAFVSCMFFQDFILKVVVFLYPSYESTEYLEGTGFSWINILRCAAVLGFALIMYKQAIAGDRRMMFYFYLNLGALALYLFCSFLPIVSRIGYYMTVSHILFVPALIKRISDSKKRRIVTALLVIGCIGYFAMYLMKASEDGVLILPYKSFFFNDMVDILSDVV